jgi:hypothetical protein
MKGRKYKIVPILFVIGGVGWLVPIVKQLVSGEPRRGGFITSAISSFLLAIVFYRAGVAAQQKAEGDSGPPSANPPVPRSL